MNPPQTTPTGVRAPHGSPWFEISWASGETHRIPNLILRGYCPCAGCQGHSGHIDFVPGHDSDLREIEGVGNYALRLVWGDAHGTGLYSFKYLRRLGDLYAQHGDALPQELARLPRS